MGVTSITTVRSLPAVNSLRQILTVTPFKRQMVPRNTTGIFLMGRLHLETNIWKLKQIDTTSPVNIVAFWRRYWRITALSADQHRHSRKILLIYTMFLLLISNIGTVFDTFKSNFVNTESKRVACLAVWGTHPIQSLKNESQQPKRKGICEHNTLNQTSPTDDMLLNY